MIPNMKGLDDFENSALCMTTLRNCPHILYIAIDLERCMHLQVQYKCYITAIGTCVSDLIKVDT